MSVVSCWVWQTDAMRVIDEREGLLKRLAESEAEKTVGPVHLLSYIEVTLPLRNKINKLNMRIFLP